MKKSKTIRTISACMLASSSLLGCAHAPSTYHVFLGAGLQQYHEQDATPLDQAISQSVGTQVVATQGNPSLITSLGTSGQIGATEEVGGFVTTLTGFYTAYSPVNYAFTATSTGRVINETMSPIGLGLDGWLGYQIWIFRPQVSYEFGMMNLNAVVSAPGMANYSASSVESYFYLGGGLAIDVPVSSSFRIVAVGDYRVPVSSSSGVTVHQVSALAGIRVGGWTASGR